MLERYDANHLLDDLVQSGSACSRTLRTLHLINVTSLHCPIMHIGLFFNLRVLVVSPQSVDDDVLTLLADSRLEHLHLQQTRYTPPAACLSVCSARAWSLVRRDNGALRVHLCVDAAAGADEVLLQPAEAPVWSVLYRTPKTALAADRVLSVADRYASTLRTYGHEMLPRGGARLAWAQRADASLVRMARQCANLETLVMDIWLVEHTILTRLAYNTFVFQIIRERVSTATLLLIARNSRTLKTLHVRRNAVIQRCDWPRQPEWTTEYWRWLHRTSQSYDRTEAEIALLLGRPGDDASDWHMLADRDFRRVMVLVRD